MQTESVHSIARQMAQNGERTAQAVNSLSRAIQSLESTWDGGSSEAFGMEMQDILRHLNTQAEMLMELAARVEREAAEWEETDRDGFGDLKGTITSGMPGLPGFPVIKPSWVIPWIVTTFVVLPPWLIDWLDRFFPQPPIISPIPDDTVVTPPSSTPTTESKDSKSKLGELMDKAREEEERKKAEQKQAEESQKPDEAPKEKEAEQPKPAHISDYPAREDDGTYLVGQEKGDSCAIASTKMVLHDLDVDVSESDLRDASNEIDGGYQNGKKWGTNPSSLDDLVNNKYGDKVTAEYNGSQTVANLETAANDGKGIVVTVKNSEWFGSSEAHSVTVVGVTTENGKQMVLVNDPWPPGEGKRLSIPAEDFEGAWYGDAMYVSKK